MLRCWWRRLWAWCKPQGDAPPEVLRAKALLQAIDAGGVPLNPAKVNAIARGLGLEVSRQASMDATLERIRLALARLGH